ncbi:MAG: sodium:solute symporter family protein [Candidatus Hydrogenedentota bacterium]
MNDTNFVGAPIDLFVVAFYFVAVVSFGLWFGKYTKSTKDFFFGGQRFSWWLIAFSGVATTVGSYSFVKYSDVGFQYGLSSTQSYMNDWFWMPILLLLWLPIIYFGRIQSVPEYFERRFGTVSRHAATALILLYLIGYVGINLFTLGVLVQTLTGLPIMVGAIGTAFVVMLYMFAGGQTSVIMTDLAQGFILLVAGLGLFFVGIYHFGGFGNFWDLLPRSHKFMYSEFNAPDNFSFIGIYGQDGLANTGAFVLMNQGMIMRFLSLRSVKEARKMAVFWMLILYPLAAITVSGGGWIAAALVANGEIETNGKDAFVDAASFLLMPGVFGFVLAALTAALMSTADTLVTAVSSIVINDIYRPYIKPDAADKHYLKVARISSMCTVFVGVLLVLVFMKQDSIYSAHGMFTAAVTPPIVTAIFLGILWKKYSTKAALATMIGGGILIGLSFHDSLDNLFLQPFSFGMGEDSYKFTRSFFGLAACGTIGIIVTLFTKPREEAQLVGLVNGTQLDAMRAFKGGSTPNRTPGKWATIPVVVDPELDAMNKVLVPQSALDTMSAEVDDLIYVTDPRWWFGGLRSFHCSATGVTDGDAIRISQEAFDYAHFKEGQTVSIEKIL